MQYLRSSLLILALAIPHLVCAQTNRSLAILDLESRGISANEVASLTDRLRSELVRTGRINVVERGQMEQILGEQDFQLTGCTSDECAVEVGQMLGVTHMVAGSIGRVGLTFSIDLRTIDVQTGRIIYSIIRDYRGEIDGLLNQMAFVADELAGTITVQEPLVEQPPIQPQPTVQQPLQQPDTVDIMKSQALKVYLDCRRCDEDYIREEITFVNFMRDRKDAQVHILVTSQRTASGGREYTLAFIGQQEFTGKNDTLTYVSNEQDTDNIVRSGMVRTLKLGLASYAAKTPLADHLNLSFARKVSPTAVEDRWDSWVFRLSTNPRFSGEESRNSIDLNGSVSADRITEALKIRLSLRGDYEEENFVIDDEDDGDGGDGEWETGITSSRDYSGLVVKSITEHWSVGASLLVNSSTYRNIQRGITLSPAVEYNLFPYSESTRRELRFLYKINSNDYQYVDTTIYNKTAETLFSQFLDINLELTEKWGTLRVGLEASHYFHDFGKNRLQLSSNLDLRLFKGLSLSLNGSVERIHDQLSLRKEGPTEKDVYLETEELATEFEYRGFIGLSYTFGSIYSNVVNPRFGDDERGRRRFFFVR